jgi:lysophospholipase L1-like esterase
VQSGIIGDGRGEDFAAVAEKTGAVYFPDILDGIFGDSRYMSDPIHPNDAGYARIAERLAPIVADLYLSH